ncbi:MAG: hypothetical protein ACI9JN_000431 [Bacteroidia bacterium]|jgi:hypothetical protein
MKQTSVVHIVTYLTVLAVFNCSCDSKSKNAQDNDQISSEKILILDQTDLGNNLEVHITMKSDTFNYEDDVLFNIEIINQDTTAVKLLFDKPLTSFGPWSTEASLIDIQTDSSVLKYGNKAILSSQLYFEEDLKAHYRILKLGESMNKDYALTDIVVLNAANQVLGRSSYKLSLWYYDVLSNEVSFFVR